MQRQEKDGEKKMIKFNELPDRLHDKMHHNKDTDCWEWLAGKNENGFPVYYDYRNRKKGSAARIIYEQLLNVPVPEGKYCVRNCGNMLCCNPAHIKLLTSKVVPKWNCKECGDDLIVKYKKRNGKMVRVSHCKECSKKRRKEYRDRKNRRLYGPEALLKKVIGL